MRMHVVSAVLCSLIGLVPLQGAIAENPIHGVGSLTLGKHEDGEILVHDQEIRDEWVIGGWRTYAEVHYQDITTIITAIEIVSTHKPGRSASFDIFGGVGEDYVDIGFQSQPYRGVFYNVKIYGTKVNVIHTVDDKVIKVPQVKSE